MCLLWQWKWLAAFATEGEEDRCVSAAHFYLPASAIVPMETERERGEEVVSKRPRII